MTAALKSPFPWFGGKSRAAGLIWARLGNVANYVEPFAGSLAVLLGRPHPPKIETVNDKDGFVANFWRSLQADPEATAHYADNPVNENDLHARHVWLVARREELTGRLEGDPDYYDAKIAGWWVWGQSVWIAGGWCGGEGPWWPDDSGILRPHLGDAGKGVKRQLPHLGGAGAGQGVNRSNQGLLDYFQRLADRLRNVRVCSGDWSRVCGKSVTFMHGLTGVVLDPPYSAEAGRCNDCYSVEDLTVTHAVRSWAIEQGSNPLMRIVVCGYDCEHQELEAAGWSVEAWSASGGYNSHSGNRHRERLWFSPACLAHAQGGLFE